MLRFLAYDWTIGQWAVVWPLEMAEGCPSEKRPIGQLGQLDNGFSSLSIGQLDNRQGGMAYLLD